MTQVWETVTTVDCEHDNFWGHRRHFIREAISVNTIHASLESVFSVADPFARLDGLPIGPNNVEINVKETTLSNLEG